MSTEYERPESIDQMRQTVGEWITDRPTIKHTDQSLRDILGSEIDELEKALSENASLDSISLEVGDVLFSTLAINSRDGSPDRHQKLYDSVAEYCRVCGSDMIDLFEKTLYKNEVNYPVTFFNEMTPFANPKDAMSCLRIIRKANGDSPEKLDEHWAISDRQIYGTPFFDGWVSTGKFRSFVKKSLDGVIKDGGVDGKTLREIKRLKRVGKWDMVPLKVPGNKLNWHLW